MAINQPLVLAFAAVILLAGPTAQGALADALAPRLGAPIPGRRLVPMPGLQSAPIPGPQSAPMTSSQPAAMPAAVPDPTPAPTLPPTLPTKPSPKLTAFVANDSDGAWVAYRAELQRRIKLIWSPPQGNERVPVSVSFNLHVDGHISELKLTKRSGVPSADAAAFKAVLLSSPFLPFPVGWPDVLPVDFVFDNAMYNVRGSAAAH